MLRIICLIISFLVLQLSANAAEITLAAGAGLKDVLNDISSAYMSKNPDVKINKNFVVSGVLVKQMDSGAKIDIVFVANTEYMDSLKEKKHVSNESITPFAYNTLVFIGKGQIRAKAIEDIVKLDKIAIGSPKSVPAGEYAVEAMKNAGIYGKLDQKLVMARDVRECLVYAEKGEVDGAFVYKTDSLLSKKVTVWFPVPQKFYSRIVYMSALSTSGAKNKDAADFFKFIHGNEGKQFLLKYGFETR